MYIYTFIHTHMYPYISGSVIHGASFVAGELPEFWHKVGGLRCSRLIPAAASQQCHSKPIKPSASSFNVTAKCNNQAAQ